MSTSVNSPHPFHEEKAYFKYPFESLSIVEDPKTSKSTLVYAIQEDAPPESFRKIEGLLELNLQKSVPSFLPVISKNETKKNNVFFIFDDITKSLEDVIRSNDGVFSFNEIVSYFKSVVSGMAFLEMNKKLANLKPNALFFSSGKIIKCCEIVCFSEEALKKEIENFRVLMILFCGKDPETLNELMDLENMQTFLEDLQKKFMSEICIFEDKNKVVVFISILKKLLAKKKSKRLSFIDLFGKCLQLGDKSSFEKAILIIDSEEEKNTNSSKKTMDSNSPNNDMHSLVSISHLCSKSFIGEDQQEKSLLPDEPESKSPKEKFEIWNEKRTIKTFGSASRKVTNFDSSSKEKISEISPIISLNMNYSLKENIDILELSECLVNFINEIHQPIKTFILQNNMNEKLLLQAPWATFNRNVFCKKTLECNTNDGIRLIFEHEKDWNRGITDDMLELVLGDFSELILSSSLEKFKVFAESYRELTKKTIFSLTELIKLMNFSKMKEFEIGFEIRELSDKSASLNLFETLNMKLNEIPNQLEVLTLYLNSYYTLDHCLDTVAEILQNQKNLKELHLSFSYITENMAKSKLFNVFQEFSFPKLETLTLAFYSWNYSHYLGDNSLDIFLEKLKQSIPKKMTKFSFLFSSGGKFEKTLNKLYELLNTTSINSFNIFLQGYLENQYSTQDIKTKIEEIVYNNNPNVDIESAFYNFSHKNRPGPSLKLR